jgi:RNA polymerase II C-terminal domain phosphatase-like 1/2
MCPAVAGLPKLPAFWGYTVPAWLLTTMARVMQLGRLVVVFDLDETLLLASTTETLQQRAEQVRNAV